MHATIEILMAEHRVIKSVLASLAVVAESASEGQDIARDTIRSHAEFFIGFADRCHHGKEEDLLFASLRRHGMPGDRGPVGVMLAEHEEERRHVREIARIGQGQGRLSGRERQIFAQHAKAFARMLGDHIAKEDHVLYPMALRFVPDEELDAMAGAFERFEREVTGAGEHDRLLALARELTVAQRRPAREEPASTHTVEA